MNREKLLSAGFRPKDGGTYERLVERGDGLFEPIVKCPRCRKKIIGYLERVHPGGELTVEAICPLFCGTSLPVKEAGRKAVQGRAQGGVM